MKITELRVKIKSLAAEARIIVHEEQRVRRRIAVDPRAAATFQSLRDHRRAVVGSAARRSLLAYGFLRGLPYARIEPPNSSAPDWDAVWREAQRFGGPEELTERWALWRKEADGHRAA